MLVATVSACRVDTTVTVDVNEDGSGSVMVDVVADREAADALGDPTSSLRLDDLVESGWTIEEPTVDTDSGELAISASHDFASGDELARILAALGVDHGDGSQDPVPFIGEVTLDTSSSSGRTDYSFGAALRIPGGLEPLSDPALTEVLDGLPVGRTPQELEAMGYDATRGLGDLVLRVHLPGSVGSTTGTADGGYVQWSTSLGSTEGVDEELSVKTSVTETGPSRLRTGALVAFVAAIALAGVGIMRRH